MTEGGGVSFPKFLIGNPWGGNFKEGNLLREGYLLPFGNPGRRVFLGGYDASFADFFLDILQKMIIFPLCRMIDLP